MQSMQSGARRITAPRDCLRPAQRTRRGPRKGAEEAYALCCPSGQWVLGYAVVHCQLLSDAGGDEDHER